MKNIQKKYPEVTSDDSARAIFRKVPQTNCTELPQKKNTGGKTGMIYTIIEGAEQTAAL